jgi:radical SAM superfamily enzyme YgiQ (UPF0313 family)
MSHKLSRKVLQISHNKKLAVFQIQEKIKWAHGFPDAFDKGMLNIGYQTIFSIISSNHEFSCKKVFLSSKMPLAGFDIVSFSLPFEMLYGNMIDMIEGGGLSVWSSERGEGDPILIGGGLCVTTNPETLSDVFDALVVGEAEDAMDSILKSIASWKRQKESKKKLLARLAKIDGVYVPSLYTAKFSRRNLRDITPNSSNLPKRITTLHARDINYKTNFIVSPKSSWPNFCFMEISRGCLHRCKFCLLSHAYGKPRFRDVKSIMSSAREARRHTNKIRLVAPSENEHPHITEILRGLNGMGFEVITGSQRSDLVSKGFLRCIDNETFTVAPEAGAEPLRRSIGKQIADTDFMKSISEAAGFRKIKKIQLFFIVGLPGESSEDVKSVAEFTLRVRELLDSLGRKDMVVVVNLNCFIVKPHTPFERLAQCDEREYRKKVLVIRKILDFKFKVNVMDDESIYLQSMLTRGDRKAFDAFYRIHKEGMTKKYRKIVDFYMRRRSASEFLPWKLINV